MLQSPPLQSETAGEPAEPHAVAGRRDLPRAMRTRPGARPDQDADLPENRKLL